jgi:hypothetical protein
MMRLTRTGLVGKLIALQAKRLGKSSGWSVGELVKFIVDGFEMHGIILGHAIAMD